MYYTEIDKENEYKIFKKIYNIILNDFNHIINNENEKLIEEININYILKNIVNSNSNIKSFIYEINYIPKYKNYTEFINYQTENILLIYTLQHNKTNVYEAILKKYLMNDNLINIFENHIYYINICQMIDIDVFKNNICDIKFSNQLINSNFSPLIIIYFFSKNILEHLNIYIKLILEKNNIIDIIKLINSIFYLLIYSINNYQCELYEYLISNYFIIIKKYEDNKNSILNINYVKMKYEIRNIIIKLNSSILDERANILFYHKVILSYFSDCEIEKIKCDYNEIRLISTKLQDINIINEYFNLIKYNKYDLNEFNYKEKIRILILISVLSDDIESYDLYNDLIKTNKDYFVDYLKIQSKNIILLFKNSKKMTNIYHILDNLLKYNSDYTNNFLQFIVCNKFDDYSEYYICIKNFLHNPNIFTALNDNSHIKLLSIVLSYNPTEEDDIKIINTYIENIMINKYEFNNIECIIDLTHSFIDILYKKNDKLLLYVLKTCGRGNIEIIDKLCNVCIINNNMNLFDKLIKQFTQIDIYQIIIKNINDETFILYCKTNEYIKNIFKKYVNYKKEYLINIDNKEEDLKNCKCICNICDSFYLDKNSKDYNPIFYYCNKCNMNIHDDCLFKVMKNNRGKIKDCIFCGSKTIKYMKLNTSEYKYIFYKKLLKNFDFTINSLE